MDPTVQQHSEWVEFPLATAFLVVFIFDMDRKTDMVELSTMGKSQSGESGNQKKVKIKSGVTNGKNRQRQLHVQTCTGKLVAGEYCFDCCHSRPKFSRP